MPVTYVNISLENGSLGQQVFNATDDVLGQPVLTNQPIAAGDSVAIQLVADPNGKGRMTYGYRGGVQATRNDLVDQDIVSVN
jgi:hypothetical protein